MKVGKGSVRGALRAHNVNLFLGSRSTVPGRRRGDAKCLLGSECPSLIVGCDVPHGDVRADLDPKRLIFGAAYSRGSRPRRPLTKASPPARDL